MMLASSANKRKAKPSSGKGKHWRQEEIDRFLQITTQILPRRIHEWQLVAHEYNNNRPDDMPERDEEAIRSKFKSLRNMKKPTGDSICSQNVRTAKLIQREIEKKISVETIDEDEDEDVNEENISHEDESENNVISQPTQIVSESSPAGEVVNQSSSRSMTNISSYKPNVTHRSFLNTTRTGYHEEELNKMSKSILSNSTKKQRLDADTTEEADSSNSWKINFMEFFLLQQQKLEERREERELKREQEREEREIKREQEREEQRRQDAREREEREDRREKERRQHDLLMAAILAKII
mmetsp:Transcript_8213/g.11519  ORF Transcript_8213/g.11519 Transcript_8213/m.11519 type:complete len:297 (-) Transcript_8213:1726-2616(-)